MRINAEEVEEEDYEEFETDDGVDKHVTLFTVRYSNEGDRYVSAVLRYMESDVSASKLINTKMPIRRILTDKVKSLTSEERKKKVEELSRECQLMQLHTKANNGTMHRVITTEEFTDEMLDTWVKYASKEDLRRSRVS